MTTIFLGEITAKYRTKEHFVKAYKQAGLVLSNEMYIGWNYIKQIITGEKLLLKSNDIDGFKIIPR